MSQAVIELNAKDVTPEGGVFCPNPKADMKVWDTHPRVYLDIAHTGEAKCPYCGTVYRLKDPSALHAAH
ncbi:zinc-finger domain-containing protein [Ottowia sp. VDI28]|uniref:zinc-finger domain-containing protein n=1 Tax=Ottowia sp. VDI28 TaxID=3133968 RepID=UPI003C2B20DF